MPGLRHAFQFSRISDEGQGAIIQLVCNLYTHVRVMDHVVIPASCPRSCRITEVR